MSDYIWENISGEKSGFVRGYSFDRKTDLKSFAQSLPEEIVLCSAKIVFGPEHAREILIQAAESWSRDLPLARNKSIDLLMRISCQSQITEAIKASELEKSRDIALLGLVKTVSEIQHIERGLFSKGAKRKDSVILPNKRKENSLRKLHDFPESVSKDQLSYLLAEKAALLILDK